MQFLTPLSAGKMQVWRRREDYFANSDCNHGLKNPQHWSFLGPYCSKEMALLSHTLNNSPSFFLSRHRWVTSPSAREVVVSGSSCSLLWHFQLHNTPARHMPVSCVLEKPLQAIGQQIQRKFPGVLPLSWQECVSG